MTDKNWKVGEFKVVVGTRTYLQVTDRTEDFRSWPDRTDFLRWVGSSNDISACQDWLDKTGWVQDQQDSFPFNTLGMHRADVMRKEIERLRKHTSMFDPDDAQFDEAVATFLANHTRLSQDGIDSKASMITVLLNYAANKPVAETEIAEWIEQELITPSDMNLINALRGHHG